MRNAPKFEGPLRAAFFDPKPATPKREPSIDWRTVILTGIIATATVSTVAIVRQEPRTTPAAPIAVAEPTPSPITPTPTPVPVQVDVRRAEPVEPVVRRGLPVEGQFYLVQMDGRNLLIRFMGSVRDFDALPKHPNLYDYYQIPASGHAWIFMQPAGFSAPAWVDP
jgi:hypothetical protein